MTDTGDMIRMLRKKLGWTRNKLSDASGLGVSTILNAERNSDCKVSTFEKLIEAMGYDLEILPKEF